MAFPKAHLIFIPLMGLFTSCEQFLFPEFYVENISHNSRELSVTFSMEPENETVIKNLFFYENNNRTDGRFMFSGKKVYFYPLTEITPENDYSLEIYTGAEAKDGTSLNRNYSHHFSTKTDLSSPSIKKIMHMTENEETTSSIIYFSKPVNEESLSKSISVTPPVDYLLDLDEANSTVRLVYMEKLKRNTTYCIYISTELKDLNNNHLLNQYSESFVNHTDNSELTASVAATINDSEKIFLNPEEDNHFINPEKPVIITFNKPIEISTIKSGLRIKPDILYDLSFSQIDDTSFTDKVTVSLMDIPQWSSHLSLELSDSINDNYRFLEGKAYDLYFDSEYFKPLKFISMTIDNSVSEVSVSKENNFQTITFPCEIFNPDKEIDFKFQIFFSSSRKTNEIDYFSFIEGLDVKTTNSCASIYIDRISQCITDDGLISVTANCRIKNKEQQGQIIFKLDKSIMDSLNNQMEETVILTVNKN